jgi:integrase
VSIHKQGSNWRVKYRLGGRQRSKTFTRKSDAITFEADIKRRRQLGPLLAAELERENISLDDFVRGPWRMHTATLAKPTRDKYVWALQKHLAELVYEPLLALDVARLATHQRLMLDRGATPTTVREVFGRLSGVLQVACEQGYIASNPARTLRKVAAEPREEVNVLSPVELERLIASLSGRDRAIVVLAGHLGLRPIELRSAPWRALEDGWFTVAASRTKRTAARTRVIKVPDVTALELKQWRLESGRPGDDQPIIGAMSPNAMKLWGRRHLPKGRRLYDLRHSHASALHYAGFTVPEAARRLGHGPALHVQTYAHVIDAMSGKRYEGLDALLADARAQLRFPQSSLSASEAT